MVRSLRQGTRAHAIRLVRMCYDHLGGRLGVELMGAMIEQDILAGGDGAFHPDQVRDDHLSAPGRDVDYELTDPGAGLLCDFGIDLDALTVLRRPFIRYCLDWSEQRHHLAGALGASLAKNLFDLGWIRRAERSHAVHITDAGICGLKTTFGIELEGASSDHAV
ncbi:MAG: hypothetical protein ACR2JC_12020 [Chloroflexota bacterium]